ncbi:hypothetical protein [uncultured Treponema sp.]|uniref:hypothetical protein n=1 Tax=uncultured Treponema sp. TaxID=162155 RepID=UPI0025E5C3FB|nr:hypothetical protein [uncultured Treponema sp.]
MKSKVLKLFLFFIQIIFLAACSGGGSSSDDNEETEEKEFFHYVNSETGFTGTATWQASNDVEKSMFLFVGKMHIGCEDSQGNELWGRWVGCTINTADYTVTASLTTNDGEILKYADIPGIKIKAELHFDLNGQTVLVASQNGLKGPEAYGEVKISDFKLSDYLNRWNTETGSNYKKRRFYAKRVPSYPDKYETPVIKVQSLSIYVADIKQTVEASIDWTSNYKDFSYNSTVDFGDGSFKGRFILTLYSNDKYYNNACLVSDYQSEYLDNKVENSLCNVTVTSTNGNSYTFYTSLKEIFGN